MRPTTKRAAAKHSASVSAAEPAATIGATRGAGRRAAVAAASAVGAAVLAAAARAAAAERAAATGAVAVTAAAWCAAATAAKRAAVAAAVELVASAFVGLLALAGLAEARCGVDYPALPDASLHGSTHRVRACALGSSGTRGACEAANAAQVRRSRTRHVQRGRLRRVWEYLLSVERLCCHQLRRGQAGRVERAAVSWTIGWGGMGQHVTLGSSSVDLQRELAADPPV